MTPLKDALRDGHVAVYDFRGRHLPDLICEKPSGSVSLFSREGKNHAVRSKDIPVQHYKSLSDVPHTYADIHLLDGEAIKLLFAELPDSAPHVLVRIGLSSSWIIGLPGLVWRILIGQIKLKGIVTLRSNGVSQRWLAIDHLRFRTPARTLSSEVGIQGFLDYLREERAQYVVLRFFDKLPELHRTGGDLDLLLADEDAEKVIGFLSDNPGPIHVDTWSVSQQYYNSSLGTRILKNGVEGPAGSRVPAPKEAFLSFAYHSLYHKGYFAGIPSRLPNAEVNPKPENDYAGILARMADDLNIQVSIDMESLDEYLHEEGWRPKLGTFPLHAHGNDWVYRRLLPHRHTAEVGLGLLVLREGAIRLGLVDGILEATEQQQYTVIHKKIFDEDGKRVAMELLRGGNWLPSSGDAQDHEPAMAVVVLDTRPYSLFHAKNGEGLSRILPMKRELRKIIDETSDSMIHSADNTHEAWEYIEVCFPEEVQSIRDKIDEYFRDFEASYVEKLRFSIQRNIGVRSLRQLGRALIRRLVK